MGLSSNLEFKKDIHNIGCPILSVGTMKTQIKFTNKKSFI